MDKTKEYILMCKKAEEIQKVWEHCAGDVCSPRFSDNNTWIVGFNTGFSELKEKDIIWLPRQDQLQEMIRHKRCSQLQFEDWYSELKRFTLFCGNLPACPENYFKSMEQLWLAFVMKEKFNKKWTGNDWKKNNA